MDDEKQTLELLENLSLMDNRSSEKYLANNESDKHVVDGKLLNNACFRLLFVDENDNMSIIIPANNPHEKANVMKEGYRCISHLWGSEMRHPWKDHNVVGVEHNVEIRDNNKKKCLELFMKYKGYWWMDIFCVNQIGEDKTMPTDIGALHIMGDIYKNCKECYCILDGSDKTFDKKFKNVKLMHEEMKLAQYVTDFSPLSGIWSENYPFLPYIFGSDWVNRVWTLQECVLPEIVYFIAEYDGSPIMSLDDVVRLCEFSEGDNPWEDYETWAENCKFYEENYDELLADNFVMDLKYTHEFYKNCIGTLREIYITASEYMNFDDMRRMNADGLTVEILDNLSLSRRISTKNVDYIYGVAGLLDIIVVGNRIDKVRDSMIVSLWSKDIFMSEEYRPRRRTLLVRQYDDYDEYEAEGLSKEFAKKIYQGIFVMSNESTLEPKSMTEYNLGTVIHSIYSNEGFRDARQFCFTGERCKDHQEYMANLCVKCKKTYKENFAITVRNSGKQVKMGAIEMSELLSGDKDEIYVLPTCHIVNGIGMNNIYVTEKYIIVLDERDTRYGDFWNNRYNVGDEVIIPLHGKFDNLYVGRMGDTGYEIATIVNIDKRGNKTNVGRIFNRKNTTLLSYTRLREN